jgi:hypothetical protein
VAVGLVVGAASTTWAGQEPYVGVVGVDEDMNRYYIEEKLWRWLHPEISVGEDFRPSIYASTAEEVCLADHEHETTQEYANEVYEIPYFNEGGYEWIIQLPKKPRGNLNIQIQCGVLKPNADSVAGMFGVAPVDICAGETGEETFGLCDRVYTVANQNVIKQNYLPTVTATAERKAGGSFHLTAYRVPSAFSNIFTTTSLGKGLKGYSKNLQVLDGSKQTRVVLKSCQPETLFVKMPVSGQIVERLADDGTKALDTEYDLEAGDRIRVKLDFPRGHLMDVFCNEYSVKVMGLGDPSTEDDVEDAL